MRKYASEKRDFNIKNRLKYTKSIQPYHKVIMSLICKDKLPRTGVNNEKQMRSTVLAKMKN